MKRLALMLALLACAVPSETGPAFFTLTVISQHWSADVVRVICQDGHTVGTVRGIHLNGVVSARFRRTCESVRFEIETWDGLLYRHPGWWLVRERLTLIIGPQLVFSTVTERSA